MFIKEKEILTMGKNHKTNPAKAKKTILKQETLSDKEKARLLWERRKAGVR